MIQEIRRPTISGWAMLPFVAGRTRVSRLYNHQLVPRRGIAPCFTSLLLLLCRRLLPERALRGQSQRRPRAPALWRYVGTAHDPGLRWTNPFYSRRPISMRARNFESGHLKVNDADGNPIEIAAVVVWRVVDTAEACFVVDSYENYVKVQTESAVRNLATRYPYDAHEEHQLSLRGSGTEVAKGLKTEIQERLTKAGVGGHRGSPGVTWPTRPRSPLPMLRRQQAARSSAARQKIVEGAVGMVEMALDMLSRSTRCGSTKSARPRW